MENKESIKRYVVKDVHGHILAQNGFAVVGGVHVTVMPGYGNPTADVEYVDGKMYMTLHNIDGNGITEIVTDSQVGDEAINTVTIKTEDNPEGVVLLVRNGSRGNGITEIVTDSQVGDEAVNTVTFKTNDTPEGVTLEVRNGSRGNGITSIVTQESQEDGGVNVVTFNTTDNPTGQTFQVKNGRRGAQGESFQPIEDVSGLVLAHVPGGDNSKAMSQKGVTDAIDDKTVYISDTWGKETLDGLTKIQPLNPETGIIEGTSSNPKKYAVRIRFDAYRGQHIRIVPNGNNVAMVAFLTGWPGSSPAGKGPFYCVGTSMNLIGPMIYEGTVPSDCLYLHIAYQYGSDDVITPSSVDIISSDVKGKISDLENAVQTISGGVAQLEEDMDDAIDALDEKLDGRTIFIEKSWTKSVIDGLSLRWPIDPETDKFVGTSTSSAPYRRGRRIENASEYRGRRIRIVPNGENVAMVAFLRSWPESSGDDADYCADEPSLINVDGETYETVVPNDCTDIYVTYQWNSPTNTGNVITPSSIDIYSDVKDKIEILENLKDDLITTALDIDSDQLDGAGTVCGSLKGDNTYGSASSATYNARLLSVSNCQGATVKIVAQSGHWTRYAFLKSSGTKLDGTADYCDNTTKIQINAGSSVETTIPNGCNILYVDYIYASALCTQSIVITQSIAEKVDSLSDNKPDVIYLSADGNDGNDGTTPSMAKATFAAALNAGSKNMQVVLLSDIHHGVDLNAWNGLKQHVTIRGGKNTRSRIIVGWKLEGLVQYPEHNDVYTYTPSEGETLPSNTDNVSQWLWQHDLADTRTLISNTERHSLQRGRQYRSLSTKLKHATDLQALLSASEPCWYNYNGTLYLRVAAGSNVETNPIYIPTFGERALQAGDFSLTLSNIECWYGNIYAGDTANMTNYLFRAVDCAARYCCGPGGFVLNDAISSHLERCEAEGMTMPKPSSGGGTTGDGINMHPSLGTENPYAKGNTHTLIDCWSHDNRDDGYSDHGRSEGTIIGGLYEHNGKGGIVPSYGSHDTVYYATVSNNDDYGIFSCGEAGDGGKGTQTVCFGCVAISNGHNYACLGYSADNHHKLILNGCISRLSRASAIYAKGICMVIVRDCTDNSRTKTAAEDGATISIDKGDIIE